MTKSLLLLFLSLGVLSIYCSAESSYDTKYFRLVLDDTGHLISLLDKTNNKEYLLKNQKAALLSIGVGSAVENPSTLETVGQSLLLTFPKNNIKVVVVPKVKEEYLTFELISVSNMDHVEWIVWGPFPTIIREVIGEAVGVVSNDIFALGIQALNVKTLGGYPEAESDIEPAYDIFETGDLVDVEASWRNQKFYRGQTAKVIDGGSKLQAYTRNRFKDRIISNWKHERYVAPQFADGGIVGSSIALFGCPKGQELDVIGKIEIAEGLPHPMIDGEWAKKSRKATASYLIMSFGEENLDKALDLTETAGLKHLYHGGPFSNWGHFELNREDFPQGRASMKKFVDSAGKRGIDLGVHTLSNFISTDDPYVRPVPDPRLAKVGKSTLTQAVGEDEKEIYIASPGFFNQMENNTLHAAQIGEEIIRYREVSGEAPYRLIGCLRGAFGTTASSHDAGKEIAKLMDHGYKVFLSNADLSLEIATNIASLFNETGLKQISFDGLEGVWSTGMGQYARSLFTKTWYDHLNQKIQGKVINDASNPSHFNWHINTRYNWGEPWYAGFRESQTNYRLMNQDFYQRNLLPAMLGWFSMTASTSLEDTEWLLARAAGFDAGFAFNLSVETVNSNGLSEGIFNAIKNWETARMAGAFSADQKQRMQDISNEFKLNLTGTNKWELIPLEVSRFSHENKIRQPGEPVSSTFTFENPYQDQNLQFILNLVPEKGSEGAKLEQIVITVNQFYEWKIPFNMAPHQHLKLNENGLLILYDKNWNVLKQLEAATSGLILEKGINEIAVEGDFRGNQPTLLKIEVKTQGTPELVVSK
jgi:hypothetical protein